MMIVTFVNNVVFNIVKFVPNLHVVNAYQIELSIVLMDLVFVTRGIMNLTINQQTVRIVMLVAT